VTDEAGNVSVLCAVVVTGVTQLHDVVYITYEKAYALYVERTSSTIWRFNATTHEELWEIDVDDLRAPLDMAACERTSQLYVAEWNCVWRMSPDGTNAQRWLPNSPDDTFKPRTLSVTSTRLLVTSYTKHTRQLRQFDADGDELRCVQLPYHMEPRHAVESPTGTFIVGLDNTQLKQCQVVEVNTGGEVLRQFSGSHLPSLGLTPHVAVDSHGNIFVADKDNHHILLLDNHLSLRRVIIDEHQLNYKEPLVVDYKRPLTPWRLCYREDKGQLLIVLYKGSVAVFDVICR